LLNKEELLSYIDNNENQTTEFKTSFGKEVIESVVAFANSYGGYIFVGVKDDGTINGVHINNETLKDWINQIKVNTQPNIIVDMQDFVINDKIVVAIEVKEYPIKPIAYKNRYYKRVKNSNHLMSLDEIANEHLKSINSSWDLNKISNNKFLISNWRVA
jgi:ATP-dependent DNA helicase RecG